jgi:hypothetical protein
MTFFGDGQSGPSFQAFRLWVEQNVIAPNGSLREQIRSWRPASLRTQPRTVDEWIEHVANQMIEELNSVMRELAPAAAAARDDDDDDDDRNALGDEELLEFLFSRGMLPSYAFPTDLTSFWWSA